jgi:Flp pilus assembly protein TadB
VIGAVVAGGAAGLGLAVLARGATEDISRAVARMRERVARSALRRRRADLEVLGLVADDLVVRQVFGAIVGAASVVAVNVLLRVAGTGPSLPVVTLATLVGSVAGFVVPDAALRRGAVRRRRQFVHALSSFLDLTTVLLAGGAGLETALTASARAGGSETFVLLRDALSRARDTGRSPWQELRALGRRLGIDQLVELADSLDLAGSHGARIRESLVARSEAMRARIGDEIEASAHAATERMGIPMVLVFVGFLALIVYPALSHLVGGA